MVKTKTLKSEGEGIMDEFKKLKDTSSNSQIKIVYMRLITYDLFQAIPRI